ncbi:uncharacterized protein LOC113216704 [Frankliniella occidentalis]|uniref:Uncharacterized protein LOC113216704 n=1 Tax=Frankliniella occidentalis TaxID=133901 RepID=A0A9C6X2H7_FRAOC|nr:uncharacterized protein LOC113216704 [Frankliniella occidentalis]
MREATAKYSDVLLMDTTHQISDNNMPLVVLEVVDCYGAGRIAGSALVLSETTEVFSTVLGALKEGCSDFLEKIQTVFIDKHPGEIVAIRDVLPNAEIHLCDFHVKDAMITKKTLRQHTDQWYIVEPLLKKLIYAFSLEEYGSVYVELENTVGPKSTFMESFNKYWHNIDLVWTEYKRNKALTLGERTTSRVESHNAKIKKVISEKLPVALVIMKLRMLNHRSNVEWEHKHFNQQLKLHYPKYSKDPIIQCIQKGNTPFVADQLQRQYERSLQEPTSSVHEVTIDSCDCALFVKFKLPCSHIFRQRRTDGIQIYDQSLVPERWTALLQSSDNNDGKQSYFCVGALSSSVKVSKNSKPPTSVDRFNAVDKLCKRISCLVANFAGHQFDCAVKALLNVEDLLKSGKEVAVVGLDAGSGPSNIPIVLEIVDNEPLITSDHLGINTDEINSARLEEVPTVANENTVQLETVPRTVSVPEIRKLEAVPVPDIRCIACLNNDTPSGAHKCDTCGKSVHAFDDSDCCSIRVGQSEGYGSNGSRRCLKCAGGI